MSDETGPVSKARSSAAAFPLGQGFQAIRDEFERMFQALSRPEVDYAPGLLGGGARLGLRVDVGETEDAVIVTTELPGVSEEDLEISLEGEMLRIQAEKRSEEETEEKTWHVVERSYGKFERKIRVPPGIDPDKVDATFTDGVLTVTLPKPPESTPSAKKIAISKS